MRPCICALAFVLTAVPVFAQIDSQDTNALRELGMGGTFAFGNLAVRDLERGLDPIQQLKRFFSQVGKPLTSEQQKRLGPIVDAQVEAVLSAANDGEATRQLNLEYTRKVNEVLTQQQRNELRRYRTEQIMMRGGFQSLKLILENAQTPFTPQQEKDVEAVYVDFDRQVDQLPRLAKGRTNTSDLDKLENVALGKVVRLLTPAQRRALAASRQNAFTSKVRP